MSDFKLEFTLKQHTPLIHFQHDQAGATLRATEVKAKLDDFLLKKPKEEVDKKWFVGAGTSSERDDALAFKLLVRPATEVVWVEYVEKPSGTFKKTGDFERKRDGNGNFSTKTDAYPSFFGNMGKDYTDAETVKKFIYFPDGLEVTITTFHRDLIAFIKKYIAEFFAKYNFGTRKTKGFGSFYPDNRVDFPLQPDKWFNYKIEIPFLNFQKTVNRLPVTDYDQKFRVFFEKLDWFYRCLRGGINRKGNNDSDVFYFKSLLFLYFKSQNVQWEKKTIKEQFYRDSWSRPNRDTPPKMIHFTGLIDQKTKRPASEPLHFSKPDKKLVKDMLGLSSEEMWLSYENDKITKKHIKNGDKEIARFASPIIFKPIELTPGTMTIFILFNEDDLKIMTGEAFDITSSKKRQSLSPPLKIPAFSLDNYFKFIKNPSNFNITTHVENKNGFHNTDEFKSLESIFTSLVSLKTQQP